MTSKVDGRKGGASLVDKGLEECLAEMVQQYNISSAALRQQSERAKKEAMRKAARVGELVVEQVNGGVQKCFLHEKQIESEIRSLSATINRFQKLTHQWLSASRALNTAVKEIGDFENWMKVMEYDCKSIVAAIHNIHQA